MTNAAMMNLEATTQRANDRFAINWARNQYGNATGRAVAKLCSNGREIAVSQFGDGFTLDGKTLTATEVRKYAGENRTDARIGGE